MPISPTVGEVDPFELPEWLGTGEVTWTAQTSVLAGARVDGVLGAGPGAETLECDLLAADQAYPEPVLDEKWRQRAHQSWTHGQVLLVEYDGRLTLPVPGTGFTADRVLEALTRLAKAVGVKPERFVAALRL
jgi:hypothetical protein